MPVRSLPSGDEVRPRLTIIVPVHRGVPFLERVLMALVPLKAGDELIVAADGAVDDCHALAAAHGAHVIDIPGPCGPAVTRNVAAASAQGDVDDDGDCKTNSKARPNWPKTLIESMGGARDGCRDQHPRIASGQPRSNSSSGGRSPRGVGTISDGLGPLVAPASKGHSLSRSR